MERLKQKSTWAGIAVVLSLFGIQVGPVELQVVFEGVIAAAGIVEVIRNELTDV